MNNDTLLEDSYDNTSDNLSDEFNYINNNENNDSKYYELEKFLINEIKDSIPIKNYENILYRELDIDNVGAFQYIDELELIFNKNLKDKHRNNILKEFYTVIKDAIIKFNKNIINNIYIIIPLVNNYIFYTGIECYIVDNINEMENIIYKIINLFETINMYINNYELKEINNISISESIIDKNTVLNNNKYFTNNLENKENIRIFVLDINFII